MRYWLRLALAVLIVMMTPRSAAAQFDWVGGLLGRVTDLSIYRTVKDVTPTWDNGTMDRAEAPRGLGVELLFEVNHWTRARGEARDVEEHTPVETVVTRRGRTVTDSVTTYKTERKKIQAEDTLVLFEVGFGYAENPFRIEGSEFTLRSALRELPMLTVYGSIQWDAIGAVHSVLSSCEERDDGCGITNVGLSPYFGLRGGLVSLTGTRAFVPVPPDSTGTPSGEINVLKGSGDAFRSGLAAGIVLGIYNANVYVEAEYGRRRIPSIQWEGTIPESLPQNLDFSRAIYAIGIQLTLGKLTGS